MLVLNFFYLGPETTMGISDAAYARNLDFMQKYAGVTMTERATFDVPVDESLIQSGDFIGNHLHRFRMY